MRKDGDLSYGTQGEWGEILHAIDGDLSSDKKFTFSYIVQVSGHLEAYDHDLVA